MMMRCSGLHFVANLKLLVTGANTRRTTMGSYTHGFPVLYGLYSQESQKKGFRIADTTKYVMPVAGYYWALTNSGRYFDLLARDWVDAKKVETFRQAYDSILDKLSNLAGHEAAMTKNWTTFNTTFKVRPSNCLTTVTNDKCVQSVKLAPTTLAPFCATRWFLWWSWLDCGFTQGAYTSTGENLPSLPLLTNFLTIATEDNDQFTYLGAYSGCGPKAGQNLLKWWKTYGGSSMANALRPAGGGFTADENTQIELINDMGAYVSGNQRAVNNSGCVGLQQYITRHNIPLGIVCIEGLIVINNWIQQFKNAFSWNIPIAVSHYVVGYGGHVGIAKWFRDDPYGNLYVKVFRNPFSFETWNLGEVFAASGVYYVYPL
jgi:hypothetical protein